MKHLTRGLFALVAGLVASAGSASSAAVVLQFVYAYDTSSFFAPGPARACLDAAGSFYESLLDDDLKKIVPGGPNTWTIEFPNPSTGENTEITDPTIPLDTIIIFVGARDLGGSFLGRAGPGGWTGTGIPAWLNNVKTRGEGNTEGPTATDFGPWGGSLAVDIDTTWNLDHTAAPTRSQSDLYSVLLHELGHVLGVGTADSWDNLVNVSGEFTGPAAVAHHGGNVPLEADLSHWASDTMSTVYFHGPEQEAALDPSLTVGTRKLMTELDVAGLDDLGWDVNPIQGWTNPGGGSFETDANWSTGATPDARDIVHFGLPGSYTVTFHADQSSTQAAVDRGDVTLNLGPYTYAVDYLMLSGTDPSLRVSQGTLRVKRELMAAASWNLVLDGGGRLQADDGVTIELQGGTLAGTGILAADLTLESGDTIAPGASLGTLTIDGNLRVKSGAQYTCELGSASSDLIVTTGDVTLGGKLDLQVPEDLETLGFNVRTILNTTQLNAIHGDFIERPSAGDYLQRGVFYKGAQKGVNFYKVTLFQALAGDTDADGDVDPTDLSRLVLYWDPAGTDRTWGEGNFDDDQDGNVDPADLARLALNWSPAGYLPEGAAGVTADSTAVPEPGTLLLLAGAGVGLVLLRWRKRWVEGTAPRLLRRPAGHP